MNSRNNNAYIYTYQNGRKTRRVVIPKTYVVSLKTVVYFSSLFAFVLFTFMMLFSNYLTVLGY